MRHLKASAWLALLLASVSLVEAYDPADHQQIAERAAEFSSLDQRLKDQLSLEDGIKQSFPGSIIKAPRTVQQLLGDGANNEDSPAWRALNHFHNPLVGWDQ